MCDIKILRHNGYNMRALLAAALLTLTAGANAFTCSGTVKWVDHWSDGLEGKVNFRLNLNDGGRSMSIQTTTKEQVSIVLMAAASQKPVNVYWSCNRPTSCTQEAAAASCGFIRVVTD